MRTPASIFLPLVGLCAACGDAGVEAVPEGRPNVVLVVCDTLRADRMSVYGHGRETTPRIEALAKTGTVFEHAVAASSWTLPSMSMLLTGEYKGLADPSVLTSHFHVAESFAAAGYGTGAVVANPVLNEKLHYHRGIDEFVVERTDVMQMRAGEVVDKGLEWIATRERQDDPFFLWLHPVDPHHPYEPESQDGIGPLDESDTLAAAQESLARAREAYPGAYPDDSLDAESWAQIARDRTLYDAEIRQFDAAFGRLVDALEERGELDNTIIVITSDHGEGLWERPRNPDDAEKSAYFPALYRRHGLMLHAEQTRVPLVFHGPGVPKGERRDDFASLVDVVPTLHELCDVPLQKPLSGEPLFAAGGTDDEPIYSVCSRSHSITVDGRWRLHRPRPHRLKKAPVTPELYDLKADPGERSPIDDPDRIEELANMIDAWSKAHSPIDSMKQLDKEQLRMLDSLGYGGEIELENLADK